MKKTLFFVIAVLFSVNTFAQFSFNDDLEIVQALFKKAKKELIAESMNLKVEESENFWLIYEQYEQKRKPLAKQRIEIIIAYATEYSSMTDEKANIFAKAYLNNHLQQDMLYNRFYKKMSKKVGALNAAKWMQIEVFLQTQIRALIQSELPFIDSIEIAKPTYKKA